MESGPEEPQVVLVTGLGCTWVCCFSERNSGLSFGAPLPGHVSNLNYGLGPVGVKPVLMCGIFAFSTSSKSGRGGGGPFRYVGLHNTSPATPWSLPEEARLCLILVCYSSLGSFCVLNTSPASKAPFGSRPSSAGSSCSCVAQRDGPGWFGAVDTRHASVFQGAARCSKSRVIPDF